MGIFNIFFEVLDDINKMGADMERFNKKFPHATSTSKCNFMAILNAGKQIQNYHGFTEYGNIPWNRFSEAEKRLYKKYEERFKHSNPSDMYYWIKEVEKLYGKKFKY